MIKGISKKVCLVLLAVLVILSTLCINVGAVSAKSTIGVSNTTPKVGSTITITVRFNVDVKMQAIEGSLNFDKSKLQYVSAGGDFTSTAKENSVDFIATGNNTLFTEAYTFKVIAEGDAIVSLSGSCSDGNEEYVVKASSYSIKVKAEQGTNTSSTTSQNTNANTKAALTSIKVVAGTLSPAFKENITEYTVVVPYDQTDGLLTCEALDKKSTITVEGERQLQVGLNKRTIVVVASNGDTRRYTVTFNRLDENGNDTTVGLGDGTVVMVDGKEFVVSESNPTIIPPKGFNITTAKYGEKEIAAYSDSAGKITIVYLVAKDESEEGFYILESSTFSKLMYIESGEICYIIREDKAAPEGFYKTTYEVNGQNLPCYKYSSQQYGDFIIFSAVTTGGVQGYYRYDVKENTMQRYPEFVNGAISVDSEKDNTVTPSSRITAIALVILFVLGIIALIVLVIIKISYKPKNNEEQQEELYTIDMNSDFPDDDTNE